MADLREKQKQIWNEYTALRVNQPRFELDTADDLAPYPKSSAELGNQPANGVVWPKAPRLERAKVRVESFADKVAFKTQVLKSKLFHRGKKSSRISARKCAPTAKGRCKAEAFKRAENRDGTNAQTTGVRGRRDHTDGIGAQVCRDHGNEMEIQGINNEVNDSEDQYSISSGSSDALLHERPISPWAGDLKT